jgi:TolC family type I secretion outer membrane protein
MRKPCTRDILSNLLLALFISAFVVAPVRLAAEEAPPAGGNTAAPDVVKGADSAGGSAMEGGETLSLDRCIEIALRKSPNILAAYHEVKAGRSRVGQARSGYYPQIAATADYSKYSLSSDPTNAALDQYTATATLTQTIFDFGKTWTQVTIQQRNLDASREDLRNTTSQIVLNVKRAYYGLLQAGKNRDVFKETVAQFEQHLNQAKGFFEIGVRSKFDVTKAEVDLSNAKLSLIRAENALRIARVILNNAMGTPDAPAYTIEDTLSFRKNPITFEEAKQKAYANRPDLKSAWSRREAAEESISLARKEYFPTLSGNANYTRVSETYPPEQSGWSAGVTLTFPLFSGFLTNHQVREAKENLNILKANEEALRQDILLDVQQAYLNLQEAEERVSVAELTVKQAEENFEIARGRYEAGVGSPIEETDALVALSNAKTNLIAALSDYKIAEAALMKAMGE